MGIQPQWCQPQDHHIGDPRLRNWLLDTGSLTERLQTHCRDFQVQVLGQRQAEISLEEIRQLSPNSKPFNLADWQVREVILWGDSQPWVFARSILPQALCSAELAGLGNQALGKLIFNDPRFVRQPFEICHISTTTTTTIAKALQLSDNRDLWGRRSVFMLDNLAMSVAEIFLPQAPAYADSQANL
ncbi:chorismate--pyruvate lyase family protein [Paraglaciecola hydrolytica]|uniref:chorismate--pyruvate lyase family protein n=1 Tax=Paraglaciecola hydrolytica TaxID=1799789 RepID=UPI003899020A